jgi:tRNA A37 methylthiotransferase MiaB
LNRLQRIFLNTGHIYVSSHGYVSIEVYSSNKMLCEYVAHTLGGVVKPKMRIYKVAIYQRSALARAARKLLKAVDDDVVKDKLQLVLEYATAVNQKSRKDAVEELRKLLTEERDDHTTTKTTNN